MKKEDMIVIQLPNNVELCLLRVACERACAFAVPRQGQDFTFEEMDSFLKGKGIAPYKLPERLEIIGALPMVAEGQMVDKKALEKDIGDKLKGEGSL